MNIGHLIIPLQKYENYSIGYSKVMSFEMNMIDNN